MPRTATKKSTRVADVQLSMVASGPVLEPNSVDPYAVPGAGRRQPSATVLVSGLRALVNAWRLDGHPGLSETTRRLFEFWFEEDHPLRGGGQFRYYFAQREAIETLVYCYEVAAARSFGELLRLDKDGIKRSFDEDGNLEAYRRTDWPPDMPALAYNPIADLFPHYVVKLATGGGKTKIMALAVVWSYFHKLYEPDSPLACNFLVIAPNLIVFERLATDFRSGAIFNKDPMLPPEFRADFDMQVVLQDEAAPPSTRGTLYLTNVQRLYEERPQPPANPIEALLPPRVRKGAALGQENDLLARVYAHDDLIVIDDEAHHVHDEKLAWNRAIGSLHTRLAERGLALTAQLDFSATPKHNDGALFDEIVSDYPLADAIAAGIVKQPLLVELSNPVEVRSSEHASVRYKQWIDAGVARLKAYEAIHLPAGKQPLLFVMAAETKDADDIAAYLEALEGFAGKVLTIHTNTRGEISEAASGKSREELERLRKASREIDADNNPYRVVVSVLMLREGWDVRNVTVVVGLRAFTAASDILPEQTIGRGLRLMYGGSKDSTEQLDIIGTRAFEEFVKGLKQTDNVEFKQRNENAPIEGRPILVQPSKVGQYNLAIPQLTNLLRRSESAVDQIDVATFAVRLTAAADTELPSNTQLATRTDMLTKRIEDELELDLPLPSGSTGIIWFYTRGVLKKVRMQTTLFERLAGPMKLFLTRIVFGGPVELDEPRIW